MGLIIFGLIFVVIAVISKFTTLQKLNDNSQCIKNDTKYIKENKMNFYIILSIGILMIISGIILEIL